MKIEDFDKNLLLLQACSSLVHYNKVEEVDSKMNRDASGTWGFDTLEGNPCALESSHASYLD